MALIEKLHSAKRAKFDDFFTPYEDIALELAHYAAHFAGETVYCNCDSPRTSNFSKYFLNNFEKLRLRRLLVTEYCGDRPGQFIDWTGPGTPTRALRPQRLTGSGDFRSAEARELLRQATLVVTNPPFSLFREYLAQLVAARKKFIILGNQNAITYKEVFQLLKTDQVWLGQSDRNKSIYFSVPDNYSKPHVQRGGTQICLIALSLLVY